MEKEEQLSLQLEIAIRKSSNYKRGNALIFSYVK